ENPLPPRWGKDTKAWRHRRLAAVGWGRALVLAPRQYPMPLGACDSLLPSALEAAMTEQTRTIAGTELHPVGLGGKHLSWAYGTPPSPEEGARLLGRALDLGYNHLDTARIYGGGKNEALIGETLKGRRNEFFLASKCGIVVDGPRRGVDCSPEKIAEDIDESLKLLQ